MFSKGQRKNNKTLLKCVTYPLNALREYEYSREYCSILNSAGDGTFQIRRKVFRENKNSILVVRIMILISLKQCLGLIDSEDGDKTPLRNVGVRLPDEMT
jgi:hypothetical protein